MSTDEGTAGQTHDSEGQPGSSLTPTHTSWAATARRRLNAEEQRLLHERREHLESSRERLETELRELVDQEGRVPERVKVSTPGKIWP